MSSIAFNTIDKTEFIAVLADEPAKQNLRAGQNGFFR